MEPRMNQSFQVMDSITVGKSEFVLGVNLNAPSSYATWQCMNGDNYFWGHYFTNEIAAKQDLCKRAMLEVDCLKHEQETAPKKKAKDHAR